MVISHSLPRLLLLGFAATAVVAQTGPPPIPPVLSVTPMGIVTQDPLVQGRDGTYSALLAGKSVWLFNDTTSES
jgi:hypothetical protein